MKKTLRKKLILLAILMGLGFAYIPNHKYTDVTIEEMDYEDEQIRVFAYSLGRVFILKNRGLSAIKDELEQNDVVAVDYRATPDPNMQVLESYRISDIDIINEILEILCYYEKTDPTNWDRTLESMRNEWEMHNYSYIFKHDIGRTRDVDLNNADEENYDSHLLTKLLRN